MTLRRVRPGIVRFGCVYFRPYRFCTMLNEIQKFGGLRVAEPGKLLACANQLDARCTSIAAFRRSLTTSSK